MRLKPVTRKWKAPSGRSVKVSASKDETKPMMWDVTVSVSGNWISDGFTLTAESLLEAIKSELLPYAYDREVKVTVKARH